MLIQSYHDMQVIQVYNFIYCLVYVRAKIKGIW